MSRAPWYARLRPQPVARVLLSDYALNGAACALGMLLVAALVHAAWGEAAAATATVGVIATLAPDLVAPRRGKLAYMAVAPLLGIPLFFAVQLLRGQPLALGALLVAATFLAFLGMAWGKRGAPVAIGVMLTTIFSLSTPAPAHATDALVRALQCGLGAALYVAWSVLANTVLNARFRTQLVAQVLLALAALMRAHASRLDPNTTPDHDHHSPRDATGGVAELLARQAALADLLQSARDVVLESPRTPHRQRLAGMLMVVLDMRDHLVAGELDLPGVRQHAHSAARLADVAGVYRVMARDVTAMADALLWHRRPSAAIDHTAQLTTLGLGAPSSPNTSDAPDTPNTSGTSGATDPANLAEHLLRGVASRVSHQNRAMQRLTALARGQAQPDLAVVRNSWRLFVSPTDWSLQPFLSLWHWQQPALRHALRAALAVGTGYAITLWLPWGSHDYWVLLTIVVVLRGSLAQTLERRNQRVAGTLMGSLLATGLLALHPGTLALTLTSAVAQGVAHAFALRRYVITAVAASVLGLVQAHLLHAGSSPAFALLERVGDTVLGAGIAWVFAYVLPSWERDQLAGLVHRALKALRQHARLSLNLAALHDLDTQAELAWRLARREAYDALSALVQATQRALVEPRAVRPPLMLLEQMQGHSYQLMGQLSAIKSMMLLRRDQLQADVIAEPLTQASACITTVLAIHPPAVATPGSTNGDSNNNSASHSATHSDSDSNDGPLGTVPEVLPDPFHQDVSPWVLRRLHLATALAHEVHTDAHRILDELAQIHSIAADVDPESDGRH
ncbi:FUSC family membrane protein [Ottowia sp.]|uniref:FUSC family protein n=1 Tax=Ottowia sp. TaxID=1898956 RepID=UPI003A843095